MTGKTGVILTNTGTPASPSPKDVRDYLAEFLADPCLVTAPRFVWLPVLHLFILPTRPKKTAPKYERIWTDDGSPFMIVARSQAEKLEAEFKACGLNIPVRVGMRYGEPSVESAYGQLVDLGCQTIVEVPMYPQSARCTTLTCHLAAKKAAKKFPGTTQVTALRYGLTEGYAEALAESVRKGWNYEPGSKLLFSFHSVPLVDIKNGDAYQKEAEASVGATVRLLGLKDDDWAISYHSRFEDSRKWLGPTPKACLRKWAEEGARVAVVCPGFSTDCLETLIDVEEDLKIWYEGEMRASHPEATPDFTYIPCLNDGDAFIGALAEFILVGQKIL